MKKPLLRWIVVASLRIVLSAAAAAAAPVVIAADSAASSEVSSIEQWRTQRIASLKSENGWLTLVALLPMKAGNNSFGRSRANTLRVDHAAVPARAGSFKVASGVVTLDAAAGSGITVDGKPVTHLQLKSDASEAPTILALGTLRFFVIERAGRLFLRVRDTQNPRRTEFAGIESFPIADDWKITARFEPYMPVRDIAIMNILGLEQKMQSPGAIVFEKDGHSWRLDAIDEDPAEDELFVMFADGTTGHETYGAGRFLYVPRPRDGRIEVDFNRAINPPCAFNDFATCPLPPPQNKISLRIEAGEKRYRH